MKLRNARSPPYGRPEDDVRRLQTTRRAASRHSKHSCLCSGTSRSVTDSPSRLGAQSGWSSTGREFGRDRWQTQTLSRTFPRRNAHLRIAISRRSSSAYPHPSPETFIAALRVCTRRSHWRCCRGPKTDCSVRSCLRCQYTRWSRCVAVYLPTLLPTAVPTSVLLRQCMPPHTRALPSSAWISLTLV